MTKEEMFNIIRKKHDWIEVYFFESKVLYICDEVHIPKYPVMFLAMEYKHIDKFSPEMLSNNKNICFIIHNNKVYKSPTSYKEDIDQVIKEIEFDIRIELLTND